jgi:hypothetical protein
MRGYAGICRRSEKGKSRFHKKAGLSLMEKIEEKRYNSLGFSPKLAIFYQFQALFVNVDIT